LFFRKATVKRAGKKKDDKADGDALLASNIP